MIKKFIYHFIESEYKGYRLIYEKGYFNSFKKIILDGFHIEYSSEFTISYTINIKLLRKLKLLELNGDKLSRQEQNLMLLISKSKENVGDIEDNLLTGYNLLPYTWYWYTEPTTTTGIQEAKFFKEDQKNRMYNHSKICNQKFKQHRK